MSITEEEGENINAERVKKGNYDPAEHRTENANAESAELIEQGHF